MRKIILLVVALVLFVSAFSQETELFKANQYLQDKGEVYFKFSLNDNISPKVLTSHISIDKIVNGEVFAYANQREFNYFTGLDIPFETLIHPGDMLKNPAMHDGTKAIWDFDTYPTYSEYVSMMYQFQTDYPDLCRIVELATTVQGRKQLFAVISDSVNYVNMEPRFMFTSSMHGDEIAGYVMMLHLIDYLLSNYGTDPVVTDYVNNIEIWIMPAENPDGTYRGGDNTVSGAVRYNANNEDLNRNYKNPVAGDHPDGAAYQPESQSMMNLMDTLHFVMSGNFHGGAEVANFPYDTWTSAEKMHADDNWFDYICTFYADSVQFYGSPGYFTDVTSSGVTEGADWYYVYGSRQDYMTYYSYGREVTFEVSSTKLPAESSLLNYWEYNYRSLLNYIGEVQYGIRGTITDSITGEPLAGTVFISGHDHDNSNTISELPYGDYYRPIYAGTYQVTYDANGYLPKTYTVTVQNGMATIQNARLGKALPVAGFTAVDSLYCTAPADVQFVNTSMDAIDFFWDFGDGATSTLQSPLHTYTDYGTYSVKLIVSNTIGEDSLILVNFIQIDSLIPCSISLPQTGTAPTQTECEGFLTDNGGDGSYTNNCNSSITIAPTGASIVTVNFSSFDVEPGQSGSCNYDYVELYDGPSTASPLIDRYCNNNIPVGDISSTSGAITLKFYSDGGVVAAGFELSWYCAMPTSTPVVDFVASATESCSGLIEFSDLTTNGPTGWLWDFGDGTTSTNQNPVYQYTTAGIYSVSLIASNSFGSTELIKTDYITITMPAEPSVTNSSRCGEGDVILLASGNGTINWYDSVIDGALLFSGDTLLLTGLTETTTVYAQDFIYSSSVYVPSPGSATNGSYFNNNTVHYLSFDVYNPIILKSVEVNADSDGERTVTIRDNGNNIIYQMALFMPIGVSRININAEIPAGSGYTISCQGAPGLWRNNSGAVYPYTLNGLVSITGSSAGQPGFYYYYYDWEVQEVPCTSARVPVTAEIKPLPALNIDYSPSVCTGEETSLTASGAVEYIWNTGASTESITETILSNSIYSVTATTDGCSISDTVQIEAAVVPVAEAGPDQWVCDGTIISISATGGSGYEWSTGGTDNSISLTINQDQEIFVTVTEGICSDVDTVVIHWLENPVIIFSVTNETYEGSGDGMIDLSVSGGTPAYLYMWSTASTNEDISNLNAGDYTVTVFDSNGCTASDFATVIAEVIIPVADFAYSPPVICVGDSVEFSDMSQNSPDSWQWTFTGGSPAISTTQNPVVHYNQPGVYSVSLTVMNLAGSSNIEVVSAIEVVELSLGFSTTDESYAGALDGSATVSVSGGYSPYVYNWSNGGTNETISGIAAGNYLISVSDATGCEASGDVTILSLDEISEQTLNSLYIYPNPTQGLISIEGIQINGVIKVYDAVGKYVLSVNPEKGNNINISSLSDGIYILEMNTSQSTERVRIILSR